MLFACAFTKIMLSFILTGREKGKDVLFKIRSSPITDGLSRIPFHAWVLTSIFKDNPFIESPSTATELLLYSFLVFVRRQKEKEGQTYGKFIFEYVYICPSKTFQYFKKGKLQEISLCLSDDKRRKKAIMLLRVSK